MVIGVEGLPLQDGLTGLISSVRTNEYIKLNALALDIPLTKHQVVLH